MNNDIYKKWLSEEVEKTRNVFILIGPPAVGKSSWVRENVPKDSIVVSKDDIIEDVIFPKYRLSNNKIFVKPPQDLEIGEEDPILGKVITRKRFSKTKNSEVEEKYFEKAFKAGQELDSIYDSKISQAIASDTKNIVIDAIHMKRSTRQDTIERFKDKNFSIIAVLFEFKGYEQQIKKSADARAKDFLDKYGTEFDRGVSWDDYERIYSGYEEPSMSEGFDKIINVNRFNDKDKDRTDIEQQVEDFREWMNEGLSKYWKMRAEARAKRAKRESKNKIDREWARKQEEKSRSMNQRIHKIFEKEMEVTEEISEEIEKFMERVKCKREEMKKRMLEKKAKLHSPKEPRSKKTLPNPYKDAKTTSKYPYSKDRTGGVAKVFKKRSKASGGPTIAPGEAFGPMEETIEVIDDKGKN